MTLSHTYIRAGCAGRAPANNHEILLGVGPLESHGSQRLLLYGETLLLRSHEIM